MFYFLFEVLATDPSAGVIAAGFAIVWVNRTAHPNAETLARAFAENAGWKVRSVQVAREPRPEELKSMSLEQLAARCRGLIEGVWGYFATQAGRDPAAENQEVPARKPTGNPALDLYVRQMLGN